MKVLYTDQYGIGWSTAVYSAYFDNSPAFAQFVATHPGVIAAVEAREKEIEALPSFSGRYRAVVLTEAHPAMQQLKQDIACLFGAEVLAKKWSSLALACKSLAVEEVYGPVVIHAFDGRETVEPLNMAQEGVLVCCDATLRQLEQARSLEAKLQAERLAVWEEAARLCREIADAEDLSQRCGDLGVAFGKTVIETARKCETAIRSRIEKEQGREGGD